MSDPVMLEFNHDVDALLDMIGALYDTAANPDLWPDFLEKLRIHFNAMTAQIGHVDLDDERFAFNLIQGTPIDQKLLKRYEELVPTDPRTHYAFRHPYKPFICRMAISEEELHALPMYKEVLAPAGIEHIMAVALAGEQSSTTFLALLANKEKELYTREDLDFIGKLVPHLERAISLQKCLAKLDLERRMALNSLNSINAGIAILDRHAGVIFANELAEEIFSDEDSLSVANDKLLISSSSEHAEFISTVERVIAEGTGKIDYKNRVITVSRHSGKKPYSLLISSMNTATKLIGNDMNLYAFDRPYAMAFITDWERPQETQVELLQRMFGLTPAEASTLSLLVEGNSVREISNIRCHTEATTRDHLKAIYSKTDTKRQSDLIRLVANSPMWIARNEEYSD